MEAEPRLVNKSLLQAFDVMFSRREGDLYQWDSRPICRTLFCAHSGGGGTGHELSHQGARVTAPCSVKAPACWERLCGAGVRPCSGTAFSLLLALPLSTLSSVPDSRSGSLVRKREARAVLMSRGNC